MPIKDIISIVELKDGVSIGAAVLLILMTIIQIFPCKLNPWDSLFKWLGGKLNQDLKKEVASIKKDLDKHIKESSAKDLRDSRLQILEFCNPCIRGEKHTKEQFDFIITQCDDYERYIESNQIKNGVISSAIKEIRRLYDRCIQKNDFLKEGN